MRCKYQKENKSFAWGTAVGAGLYQCADCGQIYAQSAEARLPTCPSFLRQAHPKKRWLEAARIRRRNYRVV